jgi:oligopeptidase A
MSTTSTCVEMNPLFPSATYPHFDRIRPEHVVPAVRWLLSELETGLQQLEAGLQPTWSGLVEPLERLGDRLSRTWGVVGHLMGVQNSEALRQAYQEVQGEVVQFSLRLGQSPSLYQGLKALQSGAEWQRLDAAQRRIVGTLVMPISLGWA